MDTDEQLGNKSPASFGAGYTPGSTFQSMQGGTLQPFGEPLAAGHSRSRQQDAAAEAVHLSVDQRMRLELERAFSPDVRERLRQQQRASAPNSSHAAVQTDQTQKTLSAAEVASLAGDGASSSAHDEEQVDDPLDIAYDEVALQRCLRVVPSMMTCSR